MKYIKYIILFALGVLVGGGMCRTCTEHFRDATKMIQTDTILRIDTVVVEKPVLIERTYYDSLYVAVHDTIQVRDSVFVVLPLEKKSYKGKDYYAEVSGYQPSLDLIEVYPRTKIVTQTNASYGKPKKHSIGIGIEANYNNLPGFPVQVEYGYSLQPWFKVYGYMEYELLRKQIGIGIGAMLEVWW